MVFCKNCKHYEGIINQVNVDKCAFERNTKPAKVSYHPVNGKTEIPLRLEECFVKNRKCNCKDFDKHVMDTPLYSAWKAGMETEKRFK